MSTPLDRRRFGATLIGLAAVPTIALASTPRAEAAVQAAATRPLLKVPFPCNEVWRGATFSGHSLPYAIDFNLPSGGDTDLGRPVKASGAGRVVAATYLEGQGFGEYVKIDHGGGWETVYAHLQRGSTTVSVGDTVTDTKTIGRVGKTGLVGSTAHLHYEQRLNGDDVKIRFGSSTWVVYYQTREFSRTRC